jgi:chromosomal replication initiator protein
MRHSALVGGLEDLLGQWRSPPCLIVEDFDRFGGSPLADQLFVQLLNDRLEHQRLTILTGRTPPWTTAAFSARLRSRLLGGLVLSLVRPGREVVHLVASWTAASLGLRWLPEALDLVSKAEICPTVLADWLRDFATSRTDKSAIDIESIRMLIQPNRRSVSRDAKVILTSVARHFHLKLSELVGSSRRQALVRARGVAICLLRDVLQLKWQTIADLTGRRDHSTVLHAYAKTQRAFAADPMQAESFRQLLQDMTQRFPRVAVTDWGKLGDRESERC